VRCSNSSAPESSFFEFLDRSLGVLARECPRAYRRALDSLGSQRLSLCVDDEPMSLAAVAGRHVLVRDARPGDVHVRFDRPLVLALLDARTSLVDAALNGDLFLKGAADALVAFDDVLRAFVHGLARCVSAPHLLDSYRRETPSRRGTSNESTHRHLGDEHGR
jgi:hypothetical protein